MIRDIKNYSLRSSFLKGEFALASWESIERVISAANVFLILKFLTLYDYGVYQLVLAFYSLVSSFLLDSIHEVVTNDLSRFLKENKFGNFKKLFSEYAFFRIGVGFITTLVIFFGAGIVSGYYGQNVQGYVKIIALLFIIESCRKVLISVFKTYLHFSLLGSQAVLIALVKLVSFALLIKFNSFNIFWIIAAHVGAYGISLLFMFFRFLALYARQFGLQAGEKTSMFWQILKNHGKWAVIGEQASRINQNIRPWLIKFLINTEAVAVFSLTFGLVSMLSSLVPARTVSSLIPRELNNKERLRFIYANGIKFIAILGLILSGVAYFAFPVAINLILPKYNLVLPYFKILIFAFVPVSGFIILTRTTLVALREQKALFTRPLFQIASIVVFSFLLIPRFGIWGAVGQIAHTNFILGYILYRYLIKVRPELKLESKKLLGFSREDFQFIKENFIFVVRGLMVKLKVIKV